jgi:CheY-like chemotaxis protein
MQPRVAERVRGDHREVGRARRFPLRTANGSAGAISVGEKRRASATSVQGVSAAAGVADGGRRGVLANDTVIELHLALGRTVSPVSLAVEMRSCAWAMHARYLMLCPATGVVVMSERAKILMVDDRPENLLALETILSPLGQELVHANSGEEALRALMRDDFALILLDAQMPGMNGFDTAALVKARRRTQDIPIIFLTAADRDQRSIHHGYSAGGADYILKPFDPVVLRAKVQVFIDLWTAGQRLATQATFLRLQMADEGYAVAVLAELKDRLGGLEEWIERLAAELRPAAAPIQETVDGVERRLGWLKQALDVLDDSSVASDPTRN